MRSLKLQPKSFNDENARIKSKSTATTKHVAGHPLMRSNSHDKREVLRDLTQLNENKKTDGTLKSSIHKLHNYKSRHLEKQFERLEKRPRIEDTRDRELGIVSQSVYLDQSDSLRNQIGHIENSSELANEAEAELQLKQFERRNDMEGVISSPERYYKSHLVEDESIEEVLSNENEEDDEQYDNSSTISDDHKKNHAMVPKWNKAIFNELQYVMRKFSRNTLDENDEDTYDITMVAEYAPEIFNYMHELEYKLVPDPNYMEHQDELKWEMRSVLIDWVVQVHNRFNLLPETLFLTINYIDRFLSKRKVSLSRFQLVGAVALFIAAKYEEINCPTVQEVVYMADNAYSIEDFLKAERFMIDVLEFDMGWPGPMSFLRRTSKADDYDYETRTLAKYFLEITIMDAKFVAAQPSWLAAGAHFLSRKLLNKGEWTESHVYYSGYTEAQLRPLAEALLHNCRDPEINHKAIFEKYQERRYRRSSLFVQEYFKELAV